MPTTNKQIGERLRDRRKYLGITQEELAAALGVDKSLTHKYETGKRHISALMLGLMAELLDVTPNYFYGLEADALVEQNSVCKSVCLGPRVPAMPVPIAIEQPT